eukprot:8159319-Prorocentrum_lima.AAC.1
MQRTNTLPPDWNVRVILHTTPIGRTARKFVLLPNWTSAARLLHIVAEALRLTPGTFRLAGGVGGEQDLARIDLSLIHI